MGGYRRDSHDIEVGSRKTFHARVIRLRHIVGFEIGHDVRHLIGKDPGYWALTRTHSGVHSLVTREMLKSVLWLRTVRSLFTLISASRSVD